MWVLRHFWYNDNMSESYTPVKTEMDNSSGNNAASDWDSVAELADNGPTATKKRYEAACERWKQLEESAKRGEDIPDEEFERAEAEIHKSEKEMADFAGISDYIRDAEAAWNEMPRCQKFEVLGEDLYWYLKNFDLIDHWYKDDIRSKHYTYDSFIVLQDLKKSLKHDLENGKGYRDIDELVNALKETRRQNIKDGSGPSKQRLDDMAEGGAILIKHMIELDANHGARPTQQMKRRLISKFW